MRQLHLVGVFFQKRSKAKLFCPVDGVCRSTRGFGGGHAKPKRSNSTCVLWLYVFHDFAGEVLSSRAYKYVSGFSMLLSCHGHKKLRFDAGSKKHRCSIAVHLISNKELIAYSDSDCQRLSNYTLQVCGRLQHMRHQRRCMLQPPPLPAKAHIEVSCYHHQAEIHLGTSTSCTASHGCTARVECLGAGYGKSVPSWCDLMVQLLSSGSLKVRSAGHTNSVQACLFFDLDSAATAYWRPSA